MNAKKAARRHTVSVVLVAVGWTAFHALPVCAQLNVGRRLSGPPLPSLNPPSTTMMNNFGQLSATMGSGWSPAQLPRQVNTPNPLAFGAGYGPGGGGQRLSPYSNAALGGGLYQPTRTSLLAPTRRPAMMGDGQFLRQIRPGTLLTQVDATTFHGYSPMGNRGQGVFDRNVTRYASWGMPEMVSKGPLVDTAISGPALSGDSATSEPALSDEPGVVVETPPGEEFIPAVRMPMERLVANQLNARSEFHERRAWEAFRANHYQEACSQFAIAEAAAVRDPGRQAYLKLAQVYASMAAQQHAEAVNQLRVLLQTDPQGERSLDPAVFNRFRDVGSFYGDPTTYTQQCRLLDQLGTAQPSDVGMLALRALAAWGRNDVNTALPFAKKVIDTLQQPLQMLEQHAKTSRDQAVEARQQADQARAAATGSQDPDEVKQQREAARAQQGTAFTAEATEAKVQAQIRKLAALAALHPLLTEAVQVNNAANRGIEPAGSAAPPGGASPPVTQ